MTYKVLIIMLGIFLFTQVGAAQDESHYARGLLYRDGDQLMFVNPYADNPVAEPFPLEIAASEANIRWSPDGRFLLVWFLPADSFLGCFNLYDVDAQMWFSQEPIACNTQEIVFSHDGSQIAYTVMDIFPTVTQDVSYIGHLWLYDIERQHAQQLASTDTEWTQRSGFNNLEWSPFDTYLVYNRYHEILGGPVNDYEVMNIEDGTPYRMAGQYYANYDLVWSPDEEWFLVTIQDEYLSSSTLPITNHRGDLYLVYAPNGEQFRLTYTPTESETNYGWTENGNIAFDTVQHVNLTLEDAVQIDAPSRETIVNPEAITPSYFNERNSVLSPDGVFLANTFSGVQYPDRENIRDLVIREIGGERFSFPLSIISNSSNAIIGWRPQPTEQPTSSDE